MFRMSGGEQQGGAASSRGLGHNHGGCGRRMDPPPATRHSRLCDVHVGASEKRRNSGAIRAGRAYPKPTATAFEPWGEIAMDKSSCRMPALTPNLGFASMIRD